MKRVLCVIAGTCGLLGWASADEIGMKNVLSVWNSRQADWESAFKIAETDAKRAELLKSQPDAVSAARDLWRQVGRDLSKPYALPAIVWFLDHPQALEKAFPNGDAARKIVLNCLNALENNMVMEKGSGTGGSRAEQFARFALPHYPGKDQGYEPVPGRSGAGFPGAGDGHEGKFRDAAG